MYSLMRALKACVFWCNSSLPAFCNSSNTVFICSTTGSISLRSRSLLVPKNFDMVLLMKPIYFYIEFLFITV